MRLKFERWENGGFSLLADLSGPTLIESDRILGLFLVVDAKSGTIVGFECGHPDEDYELIMADLAKDPIPDRFDVPELGLREATIREIVHVVAGPRLEAAATRG